MSQAGALADVSEEGKAFVIDCDAFHLRHSITVKIALPALVGNFLSIQLSECLSIYFECPAAPFSQALLNPATLQNYNATSYKLTILGGSLSAFVKLR
jgi:hypothetical protein